MAGNSAPAAGLRAARRSRPPSEPCESRCAFSQQHTGARCLTHGAACVELPLETAHRLGAAGPNLQLKVRSGMSIRTAACLDMSNLRLSHIPKQRGHWDRQCADKHGNTGGVSAHAAGWVWGVYKLRVVASTSTRRHAGTCGPATCGATRTAARTATRAAARLVHAVHQRVCLETASTPEVGNASSNGGATRRARHMRPRKQGVRRTVVVFALEDSARGLCGLGRLCVRVAFPAARGGSAQPHSHMATFTLTPPTACVDKVVPVQLVGVGVSMMVRTGGRRARVVLTAQEGGAGAGEVSAQVFDASSITVVSASRRLAQRR